MNRVHSLSGDEIRALEQLHRETDDADVRSRCDIVLLSNEGLSPPMIAKRVRFSRYTVTRYIQRYEAAGLAGLLTKPRSGRPRRVTPEYEAKLLEAVKQEPRGLGLPFSNWTTANLAEYMAKQTGIVIQARQVENYLKAHRWQLRRPVRTVRHKQDPQLVAEKKKRIGELLAQADAEHILLFGDSAELSLFPTITRCWTPIGQQRVILTPGVHAEKCWDWGAVNPLTGQMVHVVHPRRNNVGFRRLLAAISRTYELPTHPERRVILFVDNDRAHQAKPVRQLLDKHGQRLQVEPLSNYSPELNAQEEIWRHMRRRVTHNHYFERMDALLEAADQFHQKLRDDPKQVLRLLSKWAKVITV